jgi:hypothetical protein
MPILSKLKNFFFGRNAASSSEEATQWSCEQGQIVLGNSEGGVPKIIKGQAATPEPRSEHAEQSISEPRVFDQQQIDAIQMSIQSQFRVINESIDIARKSKNPDTRKSRISVAQNMLREARTLAARFCLEVDGFEEAEAAIRSLQGALDSGSPERLLCDVGIEVGVFPSPSSPSRELLKEATALKKLKKFDAACEKLREAYAADGSENLMIEDRLRLPMYLLLAGKGDEGWEELNRLNSLYTDEFSLPTIANQMRVFQKKEGKQRVVAPIPVKALGQSYEPMTIGDFQTQSLSAWGDDSLITGLEFHATMQLRTPLRVLMRHGEIHSDPSMPAPRIIQAPWEGIWVSKMRSWRELGIDLDELGESTSSSDVGQVFPSRYLPFLIAVRQVYEDGHLTLHEKISRLGNLSEVPEFSGFVAAYGGADALVNRLFPKVVESIEGLPVPAKDALLGAGLNSVEKIEMASDDELLALKGMGAVRLARLRAFCSAYVGDKSAVRIAAFD